MVHCCAWRWVYPVPFASFYPCCTQLSDGGYLVLGWVSLYPGMCAFSCASGTGFSDEGCLVLGVAVPCSHALTCTSGTGCSDEG